MLYNGDMSDSGFEQRLTERDAGYQDGYNQGYSDAKQKV